MFLYHKIYSFKALEKFSTIPKYQTYVFSQSQRKIRRGTEPGHGNTLTLRPRDLDVLRSHLGIGSDTEVLTSQI